jgi:ubiquinone/menaquinone biosynthesis C-methylase UbiE
VIIDDPAHVRSQYLTEENLETRRSVWHPTADGRDATTEALDAIVADHPLRVLEVGPGTGGFAARVAAALPGVRLTAIDQSERFVELTRARGIDAREGDVQDLPFGDEAFDVVAALWMLYHVPDVGRALSEIRRVLRPGGLFVAATNGEGHLADLRVEAGGRPASTCFSSQNGEEQLRAHFAEVRRTDLRPRAVFADSSVAEAYLQSSGEDVDWRVPPFDEPRQYAGEATIFCCR